MQQVIPPFSNHLIASRLEEAAERLDRRGGQPFRAASYQRAANLVRRFDVPVNEILRQEGRDGLRELRGDEGDGPLFEGIAGIGPILAREIHETLGITTLQELEIAAVEGRLAEVAGMTPARVRLILKTITPLVPEAKKAEPPIGDLLDIDRELRESGETLLRTQRGEIHYTALPREGGDCTVIYSDDESGGRWVVATANRGPFLRDRRYVRGREKETQDHYQSRSSG